MHDRELLEREVDDFVVFQNRKRYAGFISQAQRKIKKKFILQTRPSAKAKIPMKISDGILKCHFVEHLTNHYLNVFANHLLNLYHRISVHKRLKSDIVSVL